MINSHEIYGDWAGMFSSVIIVFLPTFLLYLFLSEKIIAGVTGGDIKGDVRGVLRHFRGKLLVFCGKRLGNIFLRATFITLEK